MRGGLFILMIIAVVVVWNHPVRPSRQPVAQPEPPPQLKPLIVPIPVARPHPAAAQQQSPVATPKPATMDVSAPTPAQVLAHSLRAPIYPRSAEGWLEVQIELARRGFSSGSIDGVKGRPSEDAIRAFQANEGLSVTGQFDASTRSALTLSAPPFAKYILAA